MADLRRFVAAQAPVHDRVCRELAAGSKQSHSMCFLFPQLQALGYTSTANFYGLADLAEAVAYRDHPLLGRRLIEYCELMRRHAAKGAVAVLDDVDGKKWRSCLTLLATTPDAPPLFNELIGAFYNGQPDPRTLALLA